VNDIFIVASRQKFRYETTRGVLCVEDLWDLSLAQLDSVAKAVNKEIKEAEGEQYFVKPATTASTEVKAKFDIVLYVIKVKMEERDAAAAKAEKEATKQKIMALIDKKKDEALAGKTADELMAMLNSM
jgi:CxxC motif-containing protein